MPIFGFRCNTRKGGKLTKEEVMQAQNLTRKVTLLRKILTERGLV